MTKTLLHAIPALCSAALLGMGVAATGAAQDRSLSGELENGAALVSACRAADSARLCDGYLLGYLEAEPSVVYRDDLPSPYMQRVLRTRAPDHPQVQAVNSARYCLHSETSLAEIRERVAGFDLEAAGRVVPAEVVRQVLERDYPCRPPTDR